MTNEPHVLETWVFEFPVIAISKKNEHTAFGGRVQLTARAKRQQQAIRDMARAALALRAGAMDQQAYDAFIEDAMHYHAGNITKGKWAARCEPIEHFALPWKGSPVSVEIEFFRDAGGAATDGVSRVTVKRLDWSLVGDVRKMTDIDGSATTILDALTTVVYSNDRQVDELVVRRFREERVAEHGTKSMSTPRSPA